MKNLFLALFLSVFFASCKTVTTNNVTLNFLDEYVLADSISFKNTIIGGLSGVDNANGLYYFVVDDAKNPRFLTATINVEKRKIKGITFKDIFFLKDTAVAFYKNNALDLEAIFVDEKTQEVYFTSEGSIKNNSMPSIFKTNTKGHFISDFTLPENMQKIGNFNHNAVFEASSKSIDTKGFWVGMEGTMHTDGEEPTFAKTEAPIRITYFNKKTKKATKQFAYTLENITKPAKGNINLNGVTAILEYEKNKFFIVERTYQSGYGSYGNIIRIFEATIAAETTTIIKENSLKNTPFIPLKKRLVFNFEDVKNKLTKGIIDNIEGITFGPKLENGNSTLLLVSDDNFQVYGKQLNQFVLLEIVTK